jgi:DNA-binding transcriptional LysR family regulator
MKSWMNLRSIEAFVATIEDQSMSKAAERLGLTQSAVSQAISGLERAVGCQLIDRSVRPAKLTLAGSSFHKKATEVLDRAWELEQVVDLDLNKLLPLLRIGMVDSFAATAGPSLVQELDSIAAQWSVASGFEDTSVRALLERRVDFIISPDDTFGQFDLIAFPIFEEPFFLVTPKRASVKGKTIEALSDEIPLIRYSRRSFFGGQVDAYLRQRALVPPHRYEFDTSDAVMAMVRAGIGWAITTPLVALKSHPAAAQIECHRLPGPSPKRRLWLIARRTEGPELAERIAAAAHEAVMRHCVPELVKLTPWLEAELLEANAPARTGG